MVELVFAILIALAIWVHVEMARHDHEPRSFYQHSQLCRYCLRKRLAKSEPDHHHRAAVSQ